MENREPVKIEYRELYRYQEITEEAILLVAAFGSMDRSAEDWERLGVLVRNLENALKETSTHEAPEPPQEDQWTTYQRWLAERRADGEKDAEKGVFEWPYPGSQEPEDQDMNLAYKQGFDAKRRELGKRFRWA